MKKILAVFAMIAMVAAFMPAAASADYSLVSQYGFYDTYPESGTGAAIDRIEAYITNGAVTFLAPGFISTGYGVGFDSFVSSLVNSTHASMSTPTPQTAVSFDYSFAGAPFVPFSLDWNAFNGTSFILHEHIDVFGPGNATGVYNTTKYNAVPIPAAIWLLGTGLVGLVGIRRRFKA